MSFTFAPAKRDNEPIRLGIAGPSRSGKSKSALRVAIGMAGGKTSRVCVVNTERGGISLYADEFPGFLITDLTAPFSFGRYKEAIKAGVAAGALVVIIDSASHMHEGEGGFLAMQEAELQRMAGDDFRKREQCKFSAWIKPKAESGSFVQFMMQLNVHSIWCYRAKEKLKLVRQQSGKIEPVPQGYQPIISDGHEYEMHSLISLGENSKGVPDLAAQASGLRDPVEGFLRASIGKPLDEDFGHRLAAWAMGAKAASGGAGMPKATPAPTGAPSASPPASAAPTQNAGASEPLPEPDFGAEWFVIDANGKSHDRKTRETWIATMRDMIAKQATAVALQSARERHGPILAALHSAGEDEAVSQVDTLFTDRLNALKVEAPF